MPSFFLHNDEDIHVTASGGITTFHGTEDVDELVANATKALEFAAESGRDRVAGFNYKPPEESESQEAPEADAEEDPQGAPAP